MAHIKYPRQRELTGTARTTDWELNANECYHTEPYPVHTRQPRHPARDEQRVYRPHRHGPAVQHKGRDFHATPDSLAAGARFQDRWSWEADVHPDWVDGIKDDQPALYELIDLVRTQKRDDPAAFLCWLGMRVIEMRRVLKPTGSLYLHCDPTASHYIKALA